MFNTQAFWNENNACTGAPFSTRKPHAPLEMSFDDHFLVGLVYFDMHRYHQDYAYQEMINRQANDVLEKELGRRFYNERILHIIPRRIEEVFEAYSLYQDNQPPWLETNIRSLNDLKKMISRVREKDIIAELLPADWENKVIRYQESTGNLVQWGTGGRGPATVGTSVIGTTNLCMWMLDAPDLIHEFYSLLAEKYVEYASYLRDITGVIADGWWITDDNCCLFSPALYRKYCAPVLENLFKTFSPSAGSARFQHSDSAMAHLMPILRELGVNGVNFGPTIHPQLIRKEMPKAVIHGQIPPMLLRNGSPQEIIDCVKRDFESAGLDGGLICAPAGSYDEGTPFENLRCYMHAVQTETRYHSN